jgi:hypothetical protein
MGRALTDIVVHVDEELNEETIRLLEEEMRANDGVISVCQGQPRSHLLMVVYDAEVARAANLLPCFAARGLHAQLVGV